MNFNNLDKAPAYKELGKHSILSVKSLLSKERIEKSSVSVGGGLNYNYASMPVNDEIMALLQKLADEQEVVEKYEALLSGEVMNTGENRLVLHQLARGACLDKKVIQDGEDKDEFYKNELKRIKEFSEKVRSGEIKGSTGKPFTTVCQIGIGGSDLGPRALYLALTGYAKGKGIKELEAKFISNVDPDDAAAVMASLDKETTLFVLVSKSGTTLETLTNQKLVTGLMGDLDMSRHLVAVTSKTSPLATSKDVLTAFYMDDYIGGRYSSSSAVGGVILSIALGYDVFEEVLAGAHEADMLSLEKDITKNSALLDAAIGVYLRDIVKLPATAILPYSQALSRFPAHLQQLDMESNGKSVNRFGEPVSYPTGPIIFGEPGTNGQHSFYQLLHQGTDIVPLQFIGFKENQRNVDIVVEDSTSQEKLNANLAAQIVAFALGKTDENPNKAFAGERYSSLIYGDQLTPKALGALLAHYENKVMFQGFFWNLNSFDQEGVQLGKILAKKVLKGCEGDEVLKAYADFLI